MPNTRTLRFIINGQTITQDPSCDFSGLFPGTENYLQAEFDFSQEWESTVKVVGFFSDMGREYEPQALNSNKTCVIPTDALKNRIFKIQIIGKNNKYTLRTNKLAVVQKGGTS